MPEMNGFALRWTASCAAWLQAQAACNMKLQHGVHLGNAEMSAKAGADSCTACTIAAALLHGSSRWQTAARWRSECDIAQLATWPEDMQGPE